MEGANGDVWPFINCEGTFNKISGGLSGPILFKFLSKVIGRATAIRGCAFDRVRLEHTHPCR